MQVRWEIRRDQIWGKNSYWINSEQMFQIKAEKRVYIGKHCSLKGKQHIVLENSAIIRPYVQIWSREESKIGEGSEVGERCRISIANALEIGKKVLISPNVYITDCDHEYRDVTIHVMDQGIVQRGQCVSIGDGSFIGINTVIIGNVKSGKHSVIGANSVVTKDVPDYCVAVGSPAKVINQLK